MELEYLYHYTSIETLALILKNKTIKFTSLNYVDDSEEEQTSDFGNLGRFCFVSCWTNDSKESIALWKLYTPEMKGVRIKLPVHPFKKHYFRKGEFYFNEDVESYIDFVEHTEKTGYMINPPFNELLLKVEYTDNEEKIVPKVFSGNKVGNTTNSKVDIEPIGKYKNTYWAFQNEWRYKIFICPWTYEEIKSSTPQEHIERFNRLRTDNLSINSYFLKLDDNKVKDMEILIGPKATDSETIIVESLVKEFNPTAKVIKSCLLIR